MKLNMKEKKILYAYACPSHHNTVLHLTRKIEAETDESWYDSFYHCLRMEMDEYYRIKHRLRVLKANTDYEEELYEEAV